MQIDRIPEWALTPALEREIAGLLARCFTTDFGGRSFFQTRHHLRLVHRPQGAIIGHMALQWRAVRLGERLVTVVGLAEVSTDPGHRGQGIAAGLLQAAIAEAKASPAEFFLLFGVAKLYAAAGFAPVANRLIWTEMMGARTHDIRRERGEGLMVLPLRDSAWDGAAEVDLLGNMF